MPGRFIAKSTIDQVMEKIAVVFRVPESSFAQTDPLCRVPTVISHLGYSQSLPADLQFTLLSILNTVPNAILSGV